MPTILVPTDFSPSSDAAVEFGAAIAASSGSTLTLFHAFQLPVNMGDTPLVMISPEELKHNADASLAKATSAIRAKNPTLQLTTVSRLGDVTEELHQYCSEIQASLIVLGKHGMSGVERFFFGSTSMSIVRSIRVPVIVVPQKGTSGQVRTIAMAVDADGKDLPVSQIRQVLNLTGASLHIIHVRERNEAAADMELNVSGLSATTSTISDEDFLHGIETYIREHNIDMLMVLPHKHGFFERLTTRTHTETLLKGLDIPVACILTGE